MSGEIKKLADQNLLQITCQLASKEKNITAQLIEALAEVDRRKLYVDLSYSSLFAYCMGELKMSEGQAQRRIQAARMFRVIPEVKEKIAQGNLSLSTISKMAQHFKNEKTKTEEKIKILKKAENKSKREVEKLALGLWGKNAEVKKDIVKMLSTAKAQVTITLDEETLNLLQEIRAQNRAKGIENLGDVIKFVCRERQELKKKVEKMEIIAAKNSQVDQDNQSTRGNKLQGESKNKLKTKLRSDPSEPKTRHIPKPIRQQVFVRARFACEYEVPNAVCTASGAAAVVYPGPNTCGSKQGLEVDHLKPWSQGGTHEVSNLRLLCKAHHQRETFKVFGYT